MATDVVALLDYLKIPKAAIVGWSDGGIIGLDMAMKHADKVEKLFAFGARGSAEQRGVQQIHRGRRPGI
jgi:pimeloyl-ACP methyl ester carboxylesterase